MSVLKNRKARAILAGGVVLGVGASMTLAAWSDSEWATGTFGTGGFTFQGSTNGTDYSDHATQGTAAALNFQLDASNLTPGTSVEATYWVKAVGSDASVTIAKPATATDADQALLDALTVAFYEGTACTGTPIATGDLDETGVAARTATDGTALATCIKVTLDADYSNPAALTTGAVAWVFAAATA